MHASIARLLDLAGAPIETEPLTDALRQSLCQRGSVEESLVELLSHKNGFFVFDAALLVRPLARRQIPLGVLEWNAPSLWKAAYTDDLSSILFFAEDLFGGQFGICGAQVCVLDPETGALEATYASLNDWADAILHDGALTGESLARDWAATKGALQSGMRLVPKIPFVCGGAFEIDNLYAMDDVRSMRFRASIANQIRDLPDGTQIAFDIPDDEVDR